LKEKDRRETIERYENRLRQFGYSPETLGWGKQGRQEVRFGVLSQPILEFSDSSVLDVGCGFADLYDFLVAHGWHGTYCGIDIVPGLLKVARARHPDLDLYEGDIASDALQWVKYDYVVASGVFNAKLSDGDNLEYIELSLRNMLHLANSAVCVDFMSTHVDFQDPKGWHTDPVWAFTLAKKLSRRVVLRHDYMPYEFALFVYCDDSISMRNVFQVTDALLSSGRLP
jgi:SAM-dependent methyltransferase